MHNNVLVQVAGLPKLSVKELQTLWRDLFGEDPRCLQKTWMVRRLAYRLQEIGFSGQGGAHRGILPMFVFAKHPPLPAIPKIGIVP